MSFLFDPPDPPNPIVTSAAQTGSNVSTAVANTMLNQTNQNTPQGSLQYNQTGTFDWTDPTTGQTYSIPQSTITQAYTPTGQATFDQSQQAQYNLAALGADESARLRQQFATPFSLSGAPTFGDPNTLGGAPQAQTTFGATPAPTMSFGDPGSIGTTFGSAPRVQSTFGAVGDITNTYEDFAGERDRIEAGLMERLDPSLDVERNKYEQQLADQGIRYGSPAYEDAMRNYSMQANDARLAVIGQAGSEQQRMADMAAQRAGFENAAQQQEYAQALGRGEFGNKAQQQIYEQALGRGEFGNAAQQQLYEQMFGRGQFYNAGQQQLYSQEAQRGTFSNAALAQNFAQSQSAFNATNAARQQYLNEQFALRNQPINEITALLSGSQVQQPNFLSSQGTTIPTTDIAGILNKNFDQQMAASNQQVSTANNIIGGLFGLSSGALKGGYI